MDNSALLCMLVQSLMRFVGNFSLEMYGTCSDCGFEGIFLDFNVVVGGGFELIGKGDIL